MSNMSNIKKRRADDGLSQPPKKSKKRAKFQDEGLDSELGINTLFSRMDNQLLADHLAQKLSRFGAELSSIEVSDLTLSCEPPSLTLAWENVLMPASKRHQGHHIVAGAKDNREPA